MTDMNKLSLNLKKTRLEQNQTSASWGLDSNFEGESSSEITLLASPIRPPGESARRVVKSKKWVVVKFGFKVSSFG